MKYFRSHVLVCVDPECLEKGAHEVMDAIQDELVAQGLIDEVQVLETSRIGGCSFGPEIMVYPEGVHYGNLSVDDVPFLVQEHFLKGRVAQKFIINLEKASDEELSAPTPKELRVVLKNCGVIDPENIEDYIAEDGYQAVAKVLTSMTPDQVIDEMLRSGE
ncbi:MAG: NADH-quinone oxidoreductase subunit F, partial [Chloroflexi bacterium]|nr:NADH-quinone oxidoreductase subunit F [Chloroflexota bacterium]